MSNEAKGVKELLTIKLFEIKTKMHVMQYFASLSKRYIYRAKFFVSTLCLKFWSMLKHVGSVLDAPEMQHCSTKEIKNKIWETSNTQNTNKGMLCVIVRKIFSTEILIFTPKNITLRKYFQVYSLNLERWISVAPPLLLPNINLNTTIAKPSRVKPSRAGSKFSVSISGIRCTCMQNTKVAIHLPLFYNKYSDAGITNSRKYIILPQSIPYLWLWLWLWLWYGLLLSAM